jgi:hypothetical protein
MMLHIKGNMFYESETSDLFAILSALSCPLKSTLPRVPSIVVETDNEDRMDRP